jgi:hypothetical protein
VQYVKVQENSLRNHEKAEPPVIPEPNVEPDPSSSLNSKNPLAKVKLKLAASHINEVSFLVV